jgi:hypothetical protein
MEVDVNIEKIITRTIGIFVLFLWVIGACLAFSIILNGDADKFNMAICILSFEIIFAYPLYSLFKD